MAHAQSALTFAEKIAIRSEHCLLHFWGKKLYETALQAAISDVSGFDWENDPSRDEKLKAALNFRRNLSGRGGRFTWLPVRFGVKVQRDALCSLQESDLCALVRATRAETENCRHVSSDDSAHLAYKLKECTDPSFQSIKAAAKEAMRKTLYNESKPQESDDVILAFDRRVAEDSIPSDVSLVVYEKGKNHGLREHNDVFSIFGTVIFLINETLELPLQIYDMHQPLPTNLRPKDCIVMDPTVLHTVAFGKRVRDRVSVVFNF